MTCRAKKRLVIAHVEEQKYRLLTKDIINCYDYNDVLETFVDYLASLNIPDIMTLLAIAVISKDRITIARIFRILYKWFPRHKYNPMDIGLYKKARIIEISDGKKNVRNISQQEKKEIISYIKSPRKSRR